MKLTDLFQGRDEALVIFRGDCTKRGLNGSAVFTEGLRFELPVEDTEFTFVADSVTVKPLDKITEDEFLRHVFGKTVAPLVPSDQGEMTMSEPCTLVSFRKDSAQPMPISNNLSLSNRLA